MQQLYSFLGMNPYQQFPQQYQQHHHNRRKPIFFQPLKAFTVGQMMMFQNYNFEKYSNIEEGNKILLPTSALHQLQVQNFQDDMIMIFCLQNTFLNKQTFVGVLEFTAEDKCCVLPDWIFNNLQVEEGQEINVTLVADLPKGRFIKIQPHETKFIDLPDPKAILENELRKYSCLTVGDTIQVKFNKEFYKLDILEAKAQGNVKNDYNAICLINADIEVDFAPPLDYVESIPLQKKDSQIQYGNKEEQKFNKQSGGGQQQLGDQQNVFQGKGVRVDQKQITEQQLKKLNEQVSQQESIRKKSEEYDPRKNRLIGGVKRKEGGLQTTFTGKETKLN